MDIGLFLAHYHSLPQADQWPVRKLTLVLGWGRTLSEARFGAVLPTLQNLTIVYESSFSLESPQTFAGLNNCTELRLEPAITFAGGSHGVRLHASVLAAAPNLRTLYVERGDINNLPPTPTQPVLSNLRTLLLVSCGVVQPLMERLAPHLPSIQHLVIRGAWDTAFPQAVLGLTGLETLIFEDCRDIPNVPDGITQLSNLTRFGVFCGKDSADTLIWVSPNIGLMSKLVSLNLSGNAALTSLSREVERLTQLTELRLEWTQIGQGTGPNITRLHNLRALCVKDSRYDVGSILTSNTVLPHLEELSFSGESGLREGVLDRPLLRKLVVFMYFDSVPARNALASNLTELTLRFCACGPELNAAIGQLRALTALRVNDCNLVALPQSLAQLTNLEILDVSCNHLHVLSTVRNCTKLRVLKIHNNDLTALPDGIDALPALQRVEIHHNRIITINWSLLRGLPLAFEFDRPSRCGTRYTRYDPSNPNLMTCIVMKSPNPLAQNVHPVVVGL